MAASCHDSEYWDSLLKVCQPCESICNQEPVFARCSTFCNVFKCHARYGHYYDGLLRKCEKCPGTCGPQQEGCPQWCLKTITTTTITTTTTTRAPGRNLHRHEENMQTPHRKTPPGLGIEPRNRTLISHNESTPPAATKMTLPPTGLSALTSLDYSILLYSLLGLSMVLLFFSLGLALRVYLRKAKPRSPKTGPKCAQCDPCDQDKRNNLGTPLSVTVEMQPGGEPSDNSTPTETCVCVHCFPDLKGLDQDCPSRVSLSNQQQAIQQRAQGQNGGAMWEREVYMYGANCAYGVAYGAPPYAAY